MNSRRLFVLPASLLASLLAAAPNGAGAELTEPPLRPDWCRTDDPAAFVELARSAETVDAPALCSKVVLEANETLPDTLALPLPCGHRMLFRKVSVPTDFLLDQRVAAFGGVDVSESASSRFTRGVWDAPISGAFSEGEDGRPIVGALDSLSIRSYYVGKYELTDLQYALLDDSVLEPGKGLSLDTPECAEATQRADAASPARILPKVGLSWFDAVAFARELNSWLFSIDRARVQAGLPPFIPWEQGSSGYVRLATEAEWEFAARGGLTGARPEDRTRRFPRVVDPKSGEVRDAELREVAVVQQSGRVGVAPMRGVGTRMPNLLGLYDMVGNAEELILEMFRATRPDTLHGHAGGVVARGGSALTGDAVIGVGYRRELPLYDHLGGEGTSDLVGARVIVSAPFFVAGIPDSGARYDVDAQSVGLRNDLEHSQRILNNQGAAESPETTRNMESLVRLLEEQKIDRERISSHVTELQTALARRDTRLADASRRILRERVRTAVLTGAGIRTTGRLTLQLLFSRQEVRRYMQEEKNLVQEALERAETMIRELTNKFRQQDQQVGVQFDLFHALVLELAKADPHELQDAMREVESEFDTLAFELADPIWTPLRDQVAEARATAGVVDERTRESWRVEIDDTMLRRRELLKRAAGARAR